MGRFSPAGMTALLLVRETVNTTLSTPETTARIAKAGQHPVHNRTGIKNGLKGHGFGRADVILRLLPGC